MKDKTVTLDQMVLVVKNAMESNYSKIEGLSHYEFMEAVSTIQAGFQILKYMAEVFDLDEREIFKDIDDIL